MRDGWRRSWRKNGCKEEEERGMDGGRNWRKKGENERWREEEEEERRDGWMKEEERRGGEMNVGVGGRKERKR